MNLTPHPVRVYGWDVPDRFPLGEHDPLVEVAPSGEVARLGEIELGSVYLRGVDTPVEHVQYGHANGLPQRTDNDQLIVSLALALGLPDRGDLLVPWREIRNPEGTVIGCRALARPC